MLLIVNLFYPIFFFFFPKFNQVSSRNSKTVLAALSDASVDLI